ncbi:hypothetical protein PpBr36_09058, partial [Pyricularia pennisetigena]|uniref:hypothetical protein n=1 Tax=Pyricularia pennisetigena TaxID=1578925 RepID=UPI00114DFF93
TAQCPSLIRALTFFRSVSKGPGGAAPQNRGQLPRQVGRVADKAGFSPGRARHDIGTHDIIGWIPSHGPSWPLFFHPINKVLPCLLFSRF